MPPVLLNLVRPCLDGLSLLVFLFALVSAAHHMSTPVDAGPGKATRQAVDAAAQRLADIELEQPGAVDVALAGPLPALRMADLEHEGRHVPGRDGWDRPLVFSRLDGDWLVEVRSRGPDGQLHTLDDEFAWADRRGHARSRHELEQPPEDYAATSTP